MDYYKEFCVLVPSFGPQLAEIFALYDSLVSGGEVGTKDKNLLKEVKRVVKMFGGCDHGADVSQENGEYALADLQGTPFLDIIIRLVQVWMKLNPEIKRFVIEYANCANRQVIDAYGGGVVIVEPNDYFWLDTAELSLVEGKRLASLRKLF